MASAHSNEARRLTVASLIFLLPAVASRLGSVVLLPLYTHAMPASEYGIVGLATTVTGILSTVLNLGLTSSFARLHFDIADIEERKRFSGTVVALQAASAAIGAIGFFALTTRVQLASLESLPVWPHMALISLSSALQCFSNFGVGLLVIREETARAAKLSTAITISNLALTALFVVVLRRGAQGQLEAQALAGLLQVIFTARVILPHVTWTFSRAHADLALRFGIPLLPHMLSTWALAASDRLVLEPYVSTAELGRYSLGYAIAAVAGLMFGALGQALFPILQRNMAEANNAAVREVGNHCVFITAITSLAVASLAREALILLTPEEYWGASTFVGWVVLGFAAQAIGRLWSQSSFTAKKTVLITTSTLIGACLNIGLNVAFIPKYGAKVAAITTAIGYGAATVAHAYFGQRAHHIDWHYSSWMRITAAAFIAYGCGTFAEKLPLPACIAVKALLCAIVFPLLVIASGAISKGSLVAAFRPRAARSEK